MNEPYPPVITVPQGLCDRDAQALLDFLYALASLLESHYAAQLLRHHHRHDDNQLSLLHDPPF